MRSNSSDEFKQTLLDDTIEEYATSERQIKYRKAFVEHGNLTEAASSCNVHRSTLTRSLERMVKRASDRGYSPVFDQTHPTPPGQGIRGVSTLYGAEGEVKLQWVKTRREEEDLLESIRDFVDGLVEAVPPAPLVKTPKGPIDEKLLTVYPMGDPHIGMYAWGEEAGEDFDIEIAHRDLTNAVEALVQSAPFKSEAVVLNLGDFFHADNNLSRTQRSGHVLDVDTRWPRVMQLGARIMVDVISLALQRHSKVTVKNVIGNHDDHSAYALALILDAFYRNEPRVDVDLNPSKFWYMEFGTTLIGSTHGDTVKLPDLPGIMAADVPELWGRTKHRYWYTGHIHTKSVQEKHGVIVESFRTLAAKDAWTHSSGYRSGRDMQAIIIHDKYGEVERHRVDILRARD